MTSPFDSALRVAANSLAFAIRDAFPVSPGHTLVITKRPVATWFEATREEQEAILDPRRGREARPRRAGPSSRRL
ncbi:HIT family protein [Anaeromyxobacter sp. Fw109-5]|uniref:HIT family protein n=1 Tax=Anaeromyxobacter sp. (strain Fw109-5) TaxID=404589 RepID=UPI003510122E